MGRGEEQVRRMLASKAVDATHAGEKRLPTVTSGDGVVSGGLLECIDTWSARASAANGCAGKIHNWCGTSTDSQDSSSQNGPLRQNQDLILTVSANLESSLRIEGRGMDGLG